jgi:hypothetical protein
VLHHRAKEGRFTFLGEIESNAIFSPPSKQKIALVKAVGMLSGCTVIDGCGIRLLLVVLAATLTLAIPVMPNAPSLLQTTGKALRSTATSLPWMWIPSFRFAFVVCMRSRTGSSSICNDLARDVHWLLACSYFSGTFRFFLSET